MTSKERRNAAYSAIADAAYALARLKLHVSPAERAELAGLVEQLDQIGNRILNPTKQEESA